MSTASSTARRALAAAAVTGAALAAYACSDDVTSPTASVSDRASYDQAGSHRQYGTPVKLGNGRARTYVVLDQKNGGRALELGVALDEQAMQGLRAADTTLGEHQDHDMLALPVPAQNPTAVRFVELDWNPRGHGAPYDAPHFDFHFYTVSQAERDAIVPGDPQYAAKAAHDPPAAAIPAFYINPAATLGMPPEAVAVPAMGMHWLDPRSPELQMFPGADPSKFRPFTTTFIYGAWDGQLTFLEPMITRAYILAKRDAADAAGRNEVIPIPTSPTYPAGAFRPNAYRIAYDAQMKEYHIALTRAAQGN